MATISSLPAELLFHVFLLVAQSAEDLRIRFLKGERTAADSPEPPPVNGGTTSREIRLANLRAPPPYSWIRVTHVCRSWYNLAANSPLLWGHIAVVGEKVTMEMMGRATGVPLTVIFAMSNDQRTRVDILRNIITARAAQIEMLVVPPTPGIFNLLTSSFAVQASRLRTLLLIEPTRDSEPLHGPPANVHIPFPFPALEHFESTAFWGPVTHLCASTLKVLVLTSGHRGTDELNERLYITLAKLTRALCQTPLLEHLDVKLNDSVAQPPVPVELSHLKSVRLIGATSICALFLRLARMHSMAKVIMKCMHGGTGRWPPSMVPDVICSVIADPSRVDTSRFRPLRTVSICSKCYDHELRGWRTLVELGDERDDPEPDVYLTIPASSRLEDVLVLLGTFPFREAQSLRQGCFLWHEDPSATFRCAQALCSMPQLRQLTLDDIYPEFACELIEMTSATESLTLSRIDCNASLRNVQVIQMVAKATDRNWLNIPRCPCLLTAVS